MSEMVQNTKERVRCIRAVIHSEEQRLRAMRRWLAHQDFLGMACFLGSLTAMACVAAWYLHGDLPWWFAIPLMATPHLDPA